MKRRKLQPGQGVTIWDETALRRVEADLADTPCRASRAPRATAFPEKKAARLLVDRWGGAPPD